MNAHTPIRKMGLVVALAAIAFLVNLVAQVHGAALTWDPAGNGTNSGGSGTWDTASWWNGANDGFWINGNDAAFAGTGGVVSMLGPQSVNNLFFSGNGYTVTGNVLTLGGGQISVSSGVAATVDAGISGSAGLVQTGSGMLALTGQESYTGATTISGGTMLYNTNYAALVNDGPTLVGGSVTTLGGSGSVSSATVANNARIMAGSGGLGSLTLGSLTFQNNSRIYIQNVANYGSTAAIDVSGNNGLTANGAASSIIFFIGGAAPTNTVPQVAHLLQYTGTIQGSGLGAPSLNSTLITGGLSSRAKFSLSTTQAGYINLIYSQDFPIWTGLGSGASAGVWTAQSQSPTNWKTASSGTLATGTNFLINDTVLFDDTATGTTVVSISGTGAVIPGTVTFNNNSLNYSLTGTYGIAGQALLTKNGSGSLTIATSNSYVGGTILNAGRLNIANSAALGSAAGAFTINGGTIDNTSGGPLTLPNYPLNLNSNITFGGSSPLNLGAGSVNMNVPLAIHFNGPSALTFGGNITGGSNSVSVSGPGMLVLAGSSSYTGATTVNSGTLSVGNGGNGAALNGTSGVTLSNNATILFNHADSTTLTAPIGGAGSLVKAGSGTLSLAGVNSYSGATIISGGVLRVAAPAATSPVTGGLLYQLDPSNPSGLQLSNGTVAQLNDLSGNFNNFTASSGTVGPSILSGASGINGRSAMHFDGTDQLLLNNVTLPQTVFIVDRVTASNGLAGIWGENGTADLGVREFSSGNAWQYGGGNINDYVGPTNGGTMEINGVPVASSANGAYTLNVPQILEASNGGGGGFGATGLGQYFNTAGAGSVPQRYYIGDIGEVLAYSTVLSPSDVQQDTSYLAFKWLGTLVPANNGLPTTTSVTISNGGAFDMTGGTQTIVALSSTDGNGSKVLLGNGILTLANAANATFDGAISGSGGSLVLQGPGKQVFTGANTYNGGTTISGGTLQLGDGAAKNGSVLGNISNNSALVIANPLDQTYSGVISGGGSFTKAGAGTLVLNVPQTYAGPTAVNGGRLRLSSPKAGAPVSGFGASTSGAAATFSNGTWTFNTIVTTATPVTGGTLTLTDGVGGEQRTAFLNTPVNVGAFTASFVYTDVDLGGADGATFCLQNSSLTTTGTGGGGSSLSYAGVAPSMAIELNLYQGNNGPPGTAFTTGGSLAQCTSTAPVTLGSGDPIRVNLSYDGSNALVENLQDLNTAATFSATYLIGSLGSILGSNTTYVGFTGATGGVSSDQTISNFTFTPFGVGGGNTGNILPAATDLFVAGGGTVDLDAGPETVASLSGAGVVTNSGSSASATITVNGSESTTFSGSIKDAQGPVALAITSGTLTLSGTGSYSGGTTVSGGELIVTNAAWQADGSSLSIGDPTLLAMLPAPVVPSPVVASAAAVSPVPEPGTLAILALGIGAALAGCSRRLRRGN